MVALDGTDDTGLAGWPDGHVSGPDSFGRWPATYLPNLWLNPA